MDQLSEMLTNFISPPIRFTKGQPLSVKEPDVSSRQISLLEKVHREIKLGDKNVVFATFKETPQKIIETLEEKSLNFSEFVQDQKMIFVNFAPNMQVEELSSDYSLSPIVTRIENAIEKNNAAMVILCEIEHLKHRLPSKNIYLEADKIKSQLKNRKVDILSI